MVIVIVASDHSAVHLAYKKEKPAGVHRGNTPITSTNSVTPPHRTVPSILSPTGLVNRSMCEDNRNKANPFFGNKIHQNLTKLVPRRVLTLAHKSATITDQKLHIGMRLSLGLLGRSLQLLVKYVPILWKNES
jgi:hypothetical protein